MTNEQVFTEVQALIIEQLDADAATITMTTNFTTDLALDSLDVFEVIDQLEDKYDIEIDTDQPLSTVGDLVTYVVKTANA
ncbi:acyl carrier protein [Lactiplantibacillus fabifermentans]|uniref:Acyl carrier protein n=2 Tax=Lactiplantibacillus fabifermentans TaxID=483011 RepID=A0A0R2NR97_9LACO|nr:acyl carrier protein [Lactiplantibacillus fabifermentans]ETY74405.1 acyl carrier protein [Lactiplantibacillus fabifermentans T30PCM01]KRO28241.1 hypothetical protein DY78_GL002553 [Lactiplantibacillus fabifermentans DSM 21115]